MSSLGMQPIVADLLWTGNAYDARDSASILHAGIAAVVDVAYKEEPAALTRPNAYCRIPLHDSDGNDEILLRFAVKTVVSLLNSEIPTLVACSAGMSRSPSIAVAALAVANASSAMASVGECKGGMTGLVAARALVQLLSDASDSAFISVDGHANAQLNAAADEDRLRHSITCSRITFFTRHQVVVGRRDIFGRSTNLGYWVLVWFLVGETCTLN